MKGKQAGKLVFPWRENLDSRGLPKHWPYGPVSSSERGAQQPRRGNSPGRGLFKGGTLSSRLQQVWSAAQSLQRGLRCRLPSALSACGSEAACMLKWAWFREKGGLTEAACNAHFSVHMSAHI
ncbi:hypothetical protein V6N11_006543 [Hibiscus sabdariffa]|uniref:Uncharacterized protein n=1 Tax=Hibiscus sabdariffa TaxID=183260 RepID=A0ABR2RR87_9ROSI